MRHRFHFFRKLATALLLGLGIISIVVLRYCCRDYQAFFLNEKGTLISSDANEIARDSLTRTSEFTLKGSNGLTVRGRVRIPTRGVPPYPAVLVASGIETGHLVLGLLDERPQVIVMAIRYPHTGDVDFSGFKAISTLGEMRETGMKTIPSMLLALDYLTSFPNVDTNDVAVATVSFGTFVGVPAAALHPKVNRLIVVQGGGDVAAIVAANAERLEMPLPRKVSGWIGKLFLLPFEPNSYIADFSPRQLLMVNSPGDLLFPDESAKSLFDHARDPKEIIWHKSKHVMPGELDIIKELTEIVLEKVYKERLDTVDREVSSQTRAR
jgi:pimeloyl-ACP methyl ester carboxylesterase